MIGLALMAAVSVDRRVGQASGPIWSTSQLTSDYVLNGAGWSQFPVTVADAVAKLRTSGRWRQCAA